MPDYGGHAVQNNDQLPERGCDGSEGFLPDRHRPCVQRPRSMGKGFVLAISKRWREPEEAYRSAFASQHAPGLGNVQFIRVSDRITVANLIGQHGVRSLRSEAAPPIRYPAIRDGLTKVAEFAQAHGARGDAEDRMRAGRRTLGGDRADHRRHALQARHFRERVRFLVTASRAELCPAPRCLSMGW